MMPGLDTIIGEMKGTIAELSRRHNNMMRSGKVVEVDATKNRVRVDIGDEANPLVTPWIQWPERAGNRKTWNPPSEGEIMTVMSPSGEIDKQSWAVHGGYSSETTAPSGSGDDAVFAVGDATITVNGGTAKVVVGGSEAVLTDGEIALKTTSLSFDAATLSMNVGGGGGIGMTANSGGIAFTGGTIKHDGKSIDKSHTHNGIQPGGGTTAVPN